MSTKKETRLLRLSLLILSILLSSFLGSIYFLDHYSPEDPIFTPSSLPEIMFRTSLSIDFYLIRLRNLVLPPHIRVLELTTGFLTTKALYVACKYRIADVLQQHPLTTEELASVTRTNPEKLGRVMQHLHVQGIFKTNRNSRWANTHLSWAFQTSNPNNVLDEVMDTVQKFYTTFSDIADTIHIEKEKKPFSMKKSTSSVVINSTRIARSDKTIPFFSKPSVHLPTPTRSKKSWLASYFKPKNGIQNYRLEKFRNKRVCEIIRKGGNSFLPALLQAVPSSRGVFFDQSSFLLQVKAQFEVTFPELLERVEFVEANFPNELPFADIYIFREILNGMDDFHVLQVLNVIRNFKSQGKKQIRLIWSDFELDHPYPYIHPLISSIDLSYLVTSNGKVRTVEEREALLRKAGFETILTRRVNSMHAITEARFANINAGSILET